MTDQAGAANDSTTEWQYQRMAQALHEWGKYLDDIKALVVEQAEDEGLWFQATTVPEAYLQQELRRLHALIESEVEG